jgi:hypothetical protein
MNTPSCYDPLHGFAWGVMRAFADPLTVCRFEEGDVIHGPKHTLQVRSPRRGTAVKADEEQEPAFATNWSSPAEIMLLEQKSGDSRDIRTTQGRLWAKHSAIRGALARFDAKDVGVRLDKAGLRDHDAFAPTVELSCFVCSSGVKRSAIEAALKTALHKPNKDKKTDRDGFQLKRHGLLLEC